MTATTDAPPPERNKSDLVHRSWPLWVAVAAMIGVILLPPAQGLPVAGQWMLGVLLFAVIVWMTEAVDYAVSAVLIAALMTLLLGLAPNVAKPDARRSARPPRSPSPSGALPIRRTRWWSPRSSSRPP